MHRFLIPMILIILLISSPAASQDFEVKQVLTDSEQVVLQTRDTGIEFVAETGDEIEGWKIVKINSDFVTVIKKQQGEGNLILMKTIPVKGNRHIMKVAPKSK